MMEMEKMMNKKVFLAVGLVVGVLVLAGAAYLGGRLLAPGKSGMVAGPPASLSGPMAGGQVGEGPSMTMQRGGGPARPAGAVQVRLEPAEEIPTRAPDLSGLATEIGNNSLMVSTIEGPVKITSVDGKTSMDAEISDKPTEVVVTKETKIYQDTTQPDFSPGGAAEGEQTIQQTVEERSLSNIAPNTMVSVWGYKRGDRLVAEIIVFNQPFGTTSSE